MPYSLAAFEERWYSRAATLAPTADGDIALEHVKKDVGAWRKAAVLIALTQKDGEGRIIFTERARHLREHSGQIAFPGGKIEESDKTPEEAALRETYEEIGLSASHIRLLGRQPLYYTGTGFEIAPVVGVVKEQQPFMINAGEVASVFDVPLSFLMNPANHLRERRVIHGKERLFYALTYRGYYIWGATAGMIRALYERLYQ